MGKPQKLGDLLCELECCLQPMVDDHELQFGDILNLVYGYLVVHCPEAREEYLDGDAPVFYYGPREGLK